MADKPRRTLVEKPSVPAKIVQPAEVSQPAIDQPTAPTPRSTIIESQSSEPAAVESIRRTLREPGVDAAPNPRSTTVESSSSPVIPGRAQPVEPQVFRSMMRPPMARLTALDDGSLDQGETWRLREARTTIGRLQGDIQIPHDPDLSATHAEIIRQDRDGAYQWQLVDLDSTNGTFVRVKRLVLRHGRELILGARRLVFLSPDAAHTTEPSETDQPRATHKQQAPFARPTHLSGERFRELGGGRSEFEYPIQGDSVTIGTDPQQCQISLEDPFLSPVHARLVRDRQGRWNLLDTDSLNGIWVKVDRRHLDHGTQFLLGGQRFLVELL